MTLWKIGDSGEFSLVVATGINDNARSAIQHNQLWLERLKETLDCPP